MRPSFKEKVIEYGTCGSREHCIGPIGKNASVGKRTKCASQMEAQCLFG